MLHTRVAAVPDCQINTCRVCGPTLARPLLLVQFAPVQPAPFPVDHITDSAKAFKCPAHD